MPRSRLTTRTASILATGFGSGSSPFAPGTAGSVVGLVMFWPLSGLNHLYLLGILGVTFCVGSWASTLEAARLDQKDPGRVVIDEVVGMWATLLFLPLTVGTALVGFVLFRVMDIVKPYPARQLESLPRGWGIMADDLMAGLYANLALRVVMLVWPLT